MIHVLNVQDRNRLKSSKVQGGAGANVSLRDLLSPSFRNEPAPISQTHKRGNTNLYSEGGALAANSGPSSSLHTTTAEEVKAGGARQKQKPQ